MNSNERGSTLPIALLVILVISVLGVSLMGNVINENKRVTKTESDVQTRYLAENGLTYFEKDFDKYFAENPSAVSITSFLSNYGTPVTIGENNAKSTITAIPIDATTIKVTSTGDNGKSTKILDGDYKVSYGPPVINWDFTGKAYDFSKAGVAKLDLLSLLHLDLVKPKGSDRNFYPVPSDSIIKVKLLGDIIGIVIPIPGASKFSKMENDPVLATRDSTLLNAGLVNDLVTVNLNTYEYSGDTNVLINGGYTWLDLLLFKTNGYDDITFKKLAVQGNAMIQQDTNGWFLDKDYDRLREFTFENGLFVTKSIVIGNPGKDRGTVKINGNLAGLENLLIKNVNLQRNKGDYIYVKGDATINNACMDANSGLQLYAEGKITFNVDGATDCNTFNGFFYAEKGIEVQKSGSLTSEPLVTINGGIIGKNLTPTRLHVNPDLNYTNSIKLPFKLIPLGRSLK